MARNLKVVLYMEQLKKLEVASASEENTQNRQNDNL